MRLWLATLILVTAQPALAAGPDAAHLNDYLVQQRCTDGRLPFLLHCTARPQHVNDPMRMRRHDWPAPNGYQISDAFLMADGTPVFTWSYPPFRHFNAAHGDGGESYVIDGDTVRASRTQDGGRPAMQYFIGPGCGGTGWILFKADAPSGRWAQTVARLSIAATPDACSGLNAAFTRWRAETVTVPFLTNGQRRDNAVPMIISEHYDAASIVAARHMERSLFGKGWGRLVWEAWGRTPPRIHDLAQRCPGTAISVPPAPGWQLEDCRYATNLVSDSGGMTGAKIGWPP